MFSESFNRYRLPIAIVAVIATALASMLTGIAIGRSTAPAERPTAAEESIDAPFSRDDEIFGKLSTSLFRAGTKWDDGRIQLAGGMGRQFWGDLADGGTVDVQVEHHVRSVTVYTVKENTRANRLINAVSLGMDPPAQQQILDRVFAALRAGTEDRFETGRLHVQVQKHKLLGTGVTFKMK